MTDLILTVGAQRFGGWQSVRITRGLQQMAGSFQLTITERWAGLATPRPIRPGQSASLTMNNQRVISGWVDDVDPQYDAEQHTVSVTGRDATGDLVDCAAISKGGAFTKRTLAQIATALCAPFGITVLVTTDVGKPFDTWRIEPGETVMESLDRACRYRGVLLMSDGNGHLVIAGTGTTAAPAALVLGQNVQRANGRSSMASRFSQYTVKAQQAGTDELYGAAAAAPTATVQDPTVTRYRPTVIMAEDQANIAACKTRAQWQRTVNAARAQNVVYTVQGWMANNVLWQPNTLAPVKDPYMGINDTMLIVQVDNYLDDQGGEKTDITVMGRDAFKPIALPQPPAAQGLF